ncbi:MAG: signal peptidase I [Lachnospiraceae bacterium]|nr:signal peptidase I [Lachnospiraceae bacterium]
MSKIENPVLKEVLETSIYILAVLLISLFIVTFIGQRTVVDGSSMYPTLEDKDNLIVDKISYRFKAPERFDIIVLKYDKRVYYVKRIIGMPGETVQIAEDGKILINGEVLEENYGYEVIDSDHRGRAAEPVVLGEDEYFVMGDNRNRSSDSRYPDVGNIQKKNILGKAWVRIYPFNKFGFVKHGNDGE